MLCCMRTTIRLDDELLRDAKVHATRTGRTLTALIEDALRAALGRSERMPDEAFSLPVFRPAGGRGLQPGVDLSDSSALVDLMEGREG